VAGRAATRAHGGRAEQRDSAAERERRAQRERAAGVDPLLMGAAQGAGALAGLGFVADALIVAARTAAEAPLRVAGAEVGAAELVGAVWTEVALPALRGAGILLALLTLGAWLLGVLQVGPTLRSPWRHRRRAVPAPRRVGALAAVVLVVLVTALAWALAPELTRLPAATRAWGPAVALRFLWLAAGAVCVCGAFGAAGAASRRLGRLRLRRG
jgi:hypothetical protein